MKAKLLHKVYLRVTKEYFEKTIKKELTYTIPPSFVGAFPTIITTYTVLQRDNDTLIIAIPIGCQRLIPKDYEVLEQRSRDDIDLRIVADVTLRESQQRIVDAVDDNCIVVAPPSWGKTFTGLHILEKLHKKSLILVHTLFLGEQWRDEIEKLMGFVPDLVQTGNKRMDTPVVVATVQSVTKMLEKPENMKLFNEFGTVIVDECHTTPANTFTSVVTRLKARYKIGLSATPKRKDGKHILLPDIFADTFHVAPRENSMDPVVKMITLAGVDPGNGDWHSKIANMYAAPGYGGAIIDMCENLVAAGHKVLIVGSRTVFLDAMEELMEGCVAIHSKVPKAERAEKFAKMRSGEASILAGGINIFKEGISENYLSALVLAVSTDNVYLLEQVVGRVLRKQEGKNVPVILDLAPEGKTFRKHRNVRKGWYNTQGWKVLDYDSAEKLQKSS